MFHNLGEVYSPEKIERHYVLHFSKCEAWLITKRPFLYIYRIKTPVSLLTFSDERLNTKTLDLEFTFWTITGLEHILIKAWCTEKRKWKQRYLALYISIFEPTSKCPGRTTLQAVRTRVLGHSSRYRALKILPIIWKIDALKEGSA